MNYLSLTVIKDKTPLDIWSVELLKTIICCGYLDVRLTLVTKMASWICTRRSLCFWVSRGIWNVTSYETPKTGKLYWASISYLIRLHYWSLPSLSMWRAWRLMMYHSGWRLMLLHHLQMVRYQLRSHWIWHQVEIRQPVWMLNKLRKRSIWLQWKEPRRIHKSGLWRSVDLKLVNQISSNWRPLFSMKVLVRRSIWLSQLGSLLQFWQQLICLLEISKARLDELRMTWSPGDGYVGSRNGAASCWVKINWFIMFGSDLRNFHRGEELWGRDLKHEIFDPVEIWPR